MRYLTVFFYFRFTQLFFYSDELPRQCDTCVPPVFFTSSQQARHHFFSRDHLQKLLRMVETEKKHEQGSGWFSGVSPFFQLIRSDLLWFLFTINLFFQGLVVHLVAPALPSTVRRWFFKWINQDPSLRRILLLLFRNTTTKHQVHLQWNSIKVTARNLLQASTINQTIHICLEMKRKFPKVVSFLLSYTLLDTKINCHLMQAKSKTMIERKCFNFEPQIK